MKNCGTCRHWKFDEPDWEFDKLRLGRCGAIRMREDIINSDAIGVDRFDDAYDGLAEKALKDAKAIAIDGSGYHAAVRCTEDFGCVLHKGVE